MFNNITTYVQELVRELGQDWRIVEQLYDPEEFGNASVVLQGKHLRLRVVRERGEMFLELGSNVEPVID